MIALALKSRNLLHLLGIRRAAGRASIDVDESISAEDTRRVIRPKLVSIHHLVPNLVWIPHELRTVLPEIDCASSAGTLVRDCRGRVVTAYHHVTTVSVHHLILEQAAGSYQIISLLLLFHQLAIFI